MGSIPLFEIDFNYVSWFGVIFLIASYIRLYPSEIFIKRQLWGWTTVALVLLSMSSVAFIHWKTFAGYFFVSDSNKILAVLVSVSSFLWFKNIEIPQSRIINAIAASTFGVLLIHANSDAMRLWLWKDTIDVVGHYSLPLWQLSLFSLGVVFMVFFICSLIDLGRIWLMERPFFKWYDKHLENKLNDYKDRLLCLKE